MPLGVLFIIKTVKDEWYIVIEAYKFTVFEILRDICDLLRDNPAHPAKIDFLLEAIIVTKVTFWRKRDYCSNGSADPWTKRYQSMKPGSAFFPAL